MTFETEDRHRRDICIFRFAFFALQTVRGKCFVESISFLALSPALACLRKLNEFSVCKPPLRHKMNLLLHVAPSPLYPDKHVQSNPPTVLVQLAWAEQLWVESVHSFLSAKVRKTIQKCSDLYCCALFHFKSSPNQSKLSFF